MAERLDLQHLAGLLTLLKTAGVTAFKAGDLQIELTPPVPVVVRGEEDAPVARKTPRPAFAAGSIYDQLPDDVVPSFPGADHVPPKDESRIPTPVASSEDAKRIMERAAASAIDDFIAAETQEG